MTLQTFSDPRDANDELAGTPTTAGTYTFTMRLADYQGDQATQQFTDTINPPVQIAPPRFRPEPLVSRTATTSTSTPKAAHPSYTWSIFANDPSRPASLSIPRRETGSAKPTSGSPPE